MELNILEYSTYHWHLAIRMKLEEDLSDEEIKERWIKFYGDEKPFNCQDIPRLRERLTSISEFAKEYKEAFTKYYNKEEDEKGHFWGQRFKSVIVEDGPHLLKLLTYIDLNPIRAGIVGKPEDYRWSTLGYLNQTNNEDDLLTLQFGIGGEEKMDPAEKIEKYKRSVYEIGSLESIKGKSIDQLTLENEKNEGSNVSVLFRYLYKTRYFSESNVIGSEAFVKAACRMFDDFFSAALFSMRHMNDKKPKIQPPTRPD